MRCDGEAQRVVDARRVRPRRSARGRGGSAGPAASADVQPAGRSRFERRLQIAPEPAVQPRAGRVRARTARRACSASRSTISACRSPSEPRPPSIATFARDRVRAAVALVGVVEAQARTFGVVRPPTTVIGIPIGPPSQRPEPKSGCRPVSAPIERDDRAPSPRATGSVSTRWFHGLSAGKTGQPPMLGCGAAAPPAARSSAASGSRARWGFIALVISSAYDRRAEWPKG